jgi:separase
MPVDSSKVFYCLNSSNDLAKTEDRFASEFKKMHEVGWRGSIGRAPTEMELVSALQSKDLVM